MTSRTLTTSPTRNRQSMSMFSRFVCGVPEQPADVLARHDPVHLGHRAAPLDRVAIDRLEAQKRPHRKRQISRLQRDGELAIDGAREMLSIGVDLRPTPPRSCAGARTRRDDRASPPARSTCTTPRTCFSSKNRAMMWSMARTRLTSADLAAGRKAHVDHVALGRRNRHVVDPCFALVAAQIGGDDFHARVALERQIEDARARHVGEEKANHFAAADAGLPSRLAIDEQRIAESSHQRVRRRFVAVADRATVADEQVVEHQHFLAIGRARNSQGRANATSRLP